MARSIDLAALRTFAIARSLQPPTTLSRALARLRFVQADPIRAPARAQDLTLRHRVADYRAGDLEARYSRLQIEEDALVNYGFLQRADAQLMHPRTARRAWDRATRARASAVLEFVRDRRCVLPRDVQAHFDHGQVTNAWGGSSNAVTHLLDGMHYRGMLRVAKRSQGQRMYACAAPLPEIALTPRQRADALVSLIIAKYAPLPSRSLGGLCSALRYGAPHLHREIAAALAHARASLPQVRIDGITWLWPAEQLPRATRWQLDDEVRLLAPFDPVVWDRLRFELFWGWAYRFEAYTPAAKRLRGYYALPLLWRGTIPGWATVTATETGPRVDVGYLAGAPPRDRAFRVALDAEIARLTTFLTPRP